MTELTIEQKSSLICRNIGFIVMPDRKTPNRWNVWAFLGGITETHDSEEAAIESIWVQYGERVLALDARNRNRNRAW